MKNLLVYGLSNCDTVRKARAWLVQQSIAHEFHDFKKSGVPEDALRRWLEALGNAQLVNRRGTTWRQLPPKAQAAVVDVASAHALLMAHSSAIRRPVVEWPDGSISVGFAEETWSAKRNSAANA